MERKGNFPNRKNNDCTCAKAPGEETGNENDRGEHHHVVPVENSAGGAAAVFHEPYTERTPEKNADKVADIESNGENKKEALSDDSGEIKNSKNCGKGKPCKTDFNGVAVAFFNVCKKVFEIFDIFDLSRNKIFYMELRRTEGKIFSAGEDLKKHINDPDCPKEMENGKFFEEIPAVHNFELFRNKDPEADGCNKCKAAEKEFSFINFSEF